ncbi:MAG: GH25 family lysozyme [Lachnospiraceae bacterium]
MSSHKKYTIMKLLTAALAFSLTLGSLTTIGNAASYNKISDGIYQLLDGTAITGVTARGIDVSHWRGSIDWQQVADDDVSFAMLGTRYKGQVDPYFREFAEGAHAAGIQVGAYIYSYALDVAGAEAEADFVLDLVKDYPISYPIAYDLEDNSQAGLTPQQLAEMVNAFCAKIEAAGYYPLLYANDYWLANRIDMSMVNYDVWVARYEVKHAFANPVMWQATSSGTIAGINGNVDINFQYKDFSGDIAANLWRTIQDSTYYYQNHIMQKDTWINDGAGWYYMNISGHPATGWLTQNGTQYYLDTATGKMAQGWLQMSDGWYYFNNSGVMQTNWTNDGSAWYYLNHSGIMSTGWLQDGQIWYYLRESGAMSIGWRQINGSWYYFNGSGAMQTGWIGSDSAWYYLNPADGAMLANTQITIDNIDYQIDASGVCQAIIPEEPAAEEVPASESTDNTAAQPADENIVAIVPPLL